LKSGSPGRNPAGDGTSASASATVYQVVNSDYVGTLPSELTIKSRIACLLFQDLISLSRDMASARVCYRFVDCLCSITSVV